MNVLAISAEVENWIRVFKVVNTLLDYGVSVLLCREEVNISGTKLPSGTFIIPLEGVFKEQKDVDSLEAVSPLSEQKIVEYIKRNTPFAMFYLDLNNFKAYNDKYGFEPREREVLLKIIFTLATSSSISNGLVI